MLVAVTVSFRAPPRTPARPVSVFVVLPTVNCDTPGGNFVFTALVKSSIVIPLAVVAAPKTNANIHQAKARPALMATAVWLGRVTVSLTLGALRVPVSRPSRTEGAYLVEL